MVCLSWPVWPMKRCFRIGWRIFQTVQISLLDSRTKESYGAMSCDTMPNQLFGHWFGGKASPFTIPHRIWSTFNNKATATLLLALTPLNGLLIP
jgi:hypothetical protein